MRGGRTSRPMGREFYRHPFGEEQGPTGISRNAYPERPDITIGPGFSRHTVCGDDRIGLSHQERRFVIRQAQFLGDGAGSRMPFANRHRSQRRRPFAILTSCQAPCVGFGILGPRRRLSADESSARGIRNGGGKVQFATGLGGFGNDRQGPRLRTCRPAPQSANSSENRTTGSPTSLREPTSADLSPRGPECRPSSRPGSPRARRA